MDRTGQVDGRGQVNGMEQVDGRGQVEGIEQVKGRGQIDRRGQVDGKGQVEREGVAGPPETKPRLPHPEPLMKKAHARGRGSV